MVGCEFCFACFGFTSDWFGYYNLGSGGWVCMVLVCGSGFAFWVWWAFDLMRVYAVFVADVFCWVAWFLIWFYRF